MTAVIGRRRFLQYSAAVGAAASAVGATGIACTVDPPVEVATTSDDDRWNEATIDELQRAMERGETTASQLVDDFLDRIENWDEIEDVDEPEIYRGTPIMIRGRRLEVGAEHGDELIDVFRRLVPDHRELLLADEPELRRRIPADLPEIMRLDQWHHPDGELPSESATFRQLADVLATGDTALYAPDMPPNTQWSHWPESGTL